MVNIVKSCLHIHLKLSNDGKQCLKADKRVLGLCMQNYESSVTFHTVWGLPLTSKSVIPPCTFLSFH